MRWFLREWTVEGVHVWLICWRSGGGREAEAAGRQIPPGYEAGACAVTHFCLLLPLPADLI